MIDKINPIVGQDSALKENIAAQNVVTNPGSVSIFDVNNTEDTSANAEELSAKLAEVQSENGAILNGWNSVKETIGLGTSAEKCDEAIQKYKNGEITFEEANETIDKFASKQNSSLNLFSNIASGVLALVAVAATTAAVVASGGTLAPVAAVAIGAGSGALTKATFKATDRATNEVEGDALDAKELAKDSLSGALTGALAVATAGTGAGTTGAAEEVGKSAIKECAKKSAITGIKTGALSSGANYGIDCAFDENKDFKLGEFAEVTATGAAVGGTVGSILGGTNGFLRGNHIVSESITDENLVANSLGTTSHKVVNDRIRSIAA